MSLGSRRVVAGFTAYVVVLGALAVYRWNIWSYGNDTGTFTQVVLNTFAGFRDEPEHASHFAVHWAPLLAVLYPFVALTHSGLALQIAQIVLIGASVFPFYAFLRRYADDGLASLIALLALVYPALLSVAFTEFHEIAFYPVLVFALLWALDAGAWRSAFVCGALLLLVREEVLIVLIVFGAALVLMGLLGRRRTEPPRGLLFWEPRAPLAMLVAGTALMLASAATLGLYFGVVVTALGGWRPVHFYTYPFGRGPLALISASFTRPLEVISALATFGRFTYLLEAFGPLLFLPLASRWLLLAAPGLLVDVLSSEPIAWRMGGHYSAIYAPWLLLAAADVLVRTARGRSPVRAVRALRGAFTVCALVYLFFDPLHPAHYLQPPYADRADAVRAFAIVPAGATVDTHDEWFSRVVGTHPYANHNWHDAEYAVFAADFRSAYFKNVVQPKIRDALASGRYRIIARYGNVFVYKRARA